MMEFDDCSTKTELMKERENGPDETELEMGLGKDSEQAGLLMDHEDDSDEAEFS